MRRSTALTAAVALAFTLASERSAQADDTSGLENLLEQEVVTTASRDAEQAESAPAFSRSISADDLRRFGVRSVAEAIDFLGVGVRTSHGLGMPAINARGLGPEQNENKRVLVLIDGIAMNEPIYGSARIGQGLGIPLELIDRIEVILGPGSTLYGSNAISAVVNVVTKDAAAHAGTHVAAELSPLYDGRATITSGLRFSLFGKETSLTLGLTAFRQDGPSLDVAPQQTDPDPTTGAPQRWSRSGPATGIWGGRLENAYYTDSVGANARLVRDRVTLDVAASQLTFGEPELAGDFDDPRTRTRERRARIAAQYRLPVGTIGDVSTRVFGDVYDRDSEYVTSNPTRCSFLDATTCLYTYDGTSLRGGVDLQSTFAWLPDGSFTTRAGLWGTVVKLWGDEHGRDADTNRLLYQEHDSLPTQPFFAGAAYAEQGWRPLRWLSLTAGARIDADARFPVVPSPRAMVAVNPWEGGTLKAIYAHAFRAPTYYESHGDTRGSELRSVNLQPERVRSAELVFEQRYRTHRVAIGAFHTEYSNLTEHVTLDPAEADGVRGEGLEGGGSRAVLRQLRNEDDATSQGFTLSADSTAAHGKLHLGASATGAVVRVDGDSSQLEIVEIAPSIFGNVRAAYDLGGSLPTIGAAASFAGKTYAEGTNAFGASGRSPEQLDVRLTLSGKVPGIDGLSYRLIGGHAFHDRVPQAVGPAAEGLAPITTAALAPVQRWYGTIGLQYDF